MRQEEGSSTERPELRRWRRASALGITGLLELAQIAVAREARRRVSDFSPQARYASLPLARRERQLVIVQLAIYPVAAVLLAAIVKSSGFGDAATAMLLLAVANVPGFLSIYRVWRHNSWAAVSRLPAKPRRTRRGESD
jgi:hypothetical protein